MSELLEKLSGGQVLGMISVIVGAVYLITDSIAARWSRVRRTEAEAALKREMLTAGHSVDEIERVIRATAGKK